MFGQFIGSTLLGYTILREIGEGGMGKVYLAENATIGQQVAIKVLDPVLARNSELRERFNQEARIQVALQHNNIVRIFNAQSSDELSFLVMEYIDGESLDKVLRRRGKLSADEAIKIMRQVLDAVGYAHSKGIVHRDLKPSNILVCADGTAKVTDFGIAKVLGDTKLTRTGTSMGSPDYMSPEQVLGKNDIDHRTDIYSLGATLYEMLTGRPPFVIENGGTSDSDFLIKQAHVNRKAENPVVYNVEIGLELSEVILRSLAKKVEDRYTNVKAFTDAIAGFRGNGDVELGRSSTPGFFLRWFDKRPIFSFLVIIFFSSTASFLVYRKHKDEILERELLAAGTVLEEPTPGFIPDLPSETACDAGNAKGCDDAAKAYRTGDGVSQNYPAAKVLYLKGCNLGNHDSCSNLGAMYEHGMGDVQDKISARFYYGRACEGDHAIGCYNLASLVEAGEGGRQDFGDARNLHMKSCKAGYGPACYALGMMYEFGAGIKKDIKSANVLYRAGCSRGYQKSCSKVQR